MWFLKLRLPEQRPSRSLQEKGSQAGYLIVIHKTGQIGKAVISAWMPKSRPWMVTSRLRKCLIQVTCQPVVSWDGYKDTCRAHSLPSLDAGVRHPCRNDVSPTLLYNGESRSVGTSQTSFRNLFLTKSLDVDNPASHDFSPPLPQLAYDFPFPWFDFGLAFQFRQLLFIFPDNQSSTRVFIRQP